MSRIYLATRLYNTDDKIRACDLEDHLRGIFPDAEIFMPYRDVDEDTIETNWKETIFRNDINQLSTSDLLIGFWDGTEFDEGMGFEIGYAIAKGITVVVLNSDFIEYLFVRSGQKYILPDPLFSQLDITIIRKPFRMKGRNTYFEDLITSKKEHMNCIDKTVMDGSRLSFRKKKKVYSRYIETGASLLSFSRFGYPKRDDWYLSSRFESRDVFASSREDLSALLSAEEVYMFAHWPEMNSGSSVLAGICFALNIPFYIVNDRAVSLLGMRDEQMPVNLIVDVACAGYKEIE